METGGAACPTGVFPEPQKGEAHHHAPLPFVAYQAYFAYSTSVSSSPISSHRRLETPRIREQDVVVWRRFADEETGKLIVIF